jgi:hypothetical protein
VVGEESYPRLRLGLRLPSIPASYRPQWYQLGHPRMTDFPPGQASVSSESESRQCAKLAWAGAAAGSSIRPGRYVTSQPSY